MATFDFFDPGFGYPYGQTHKLKEANKMTKERALEKIEELKEYVKKCEEKEKKIPKMARKPIIRDQCAVVCPQIKNDTVTAWLTFENNDTSLYWAALAYELAQLLYCREYLGVTDTDIWDARTKALTVFCVRYHPGENEYGIIEIQPLMALRPHELIWCFTDNLEAQRVCDYMNRYVKDIKRQTF